MTQCPACGQPITDVFDDVHRGVLVEGKFRHLTSLEWALLQQFRRGKGWLSQATLIEGLWGRHPKTHRDLSVYVWRLRQKLSGSGYWIRNKYLAGYRLERGHGR